MNRKAKLKLNQLWLQACKLQAKLNEKVMQDITDDKMTPMEKAALFKALNEFFKLYFTFQERDEVGLDPVPSFDISGDDDD